MDEAGRTAAHASVNTMDDHWLKWDQAAVQAFRWKLKYFFMNLCEKYRARGRKPWKLTLQILKIAITTIQVGSL